MRLVLDLATTLAAEALGGARAGILGPRRGLLTFLFGFPSRSASNSSSGCERMYTRSFAIVATWVLSCI